MLSLVIELVKEKVRDLPFTSSKAKWKQKSSGSSAYAIATLNHKNVHLFPRETATLVPRVLFEQGVVSHVKHTATVHETSMKCGVQSFTQNQTNWNAENKLIKQNKFRKKQKDRGSHRKPKKRRGKVFFSLLPHCSRQLRSNCC